MSRVSRSKKLQLNISPLGATFGALILGGFYTATEVYKHHHSYHEINGIWQACFTPNQRCQKLIIEKIDEAKESISLQAYSFTDNEIMDALLRAHQRQVKVKVILDHSNLKDSNSLLAKLMHHKIPVRIDKPHGIAHNKLILIDQRILITGSYNFSKAAYKRNAENVLIAHDPTLAQEYLENCERRWQASVSPHSITGRSPSAQS